MQCFQQKLFIFNENYSAAHSETKSTFCLVGSQHYHQHTQTLFQLTLKSFTAWWCHKTLQQANITNLMENFQFFHIKLPQIFTWGHSLQPQLDRSINFKYIFFSIAYFKCIFFLFSSPWLHKTIHRQLAIQQDDTSFSSLDSAWASFFNPYLNTYRSNKGSKDTQTNLKQY